MPRLQLTSEDHAADDLLDRFRLSAPDKKTSNLAASGLMAIHQTVQSVMKKGDLRRKNELRALKEIPPTAEWRLLTPTSYCFDDPSSLFRERPTHLPVRHVASTPDRVEQHTYLPTTHSALCASEELGRTNILNVSLLLHTMDEVKSSVGALSPELQQGFKRIDRAAKRVVANAVDVYQVATYHRRWSLTQGAEHEVRARLLQDPMDAEVECILDIRRPHDAPAGPPRAAKHRRFETTDEEEEPQEKPQTTSTPVKLSIADVESVLGVSNSKSQTPQSMSSLSSFVNRVSGSVASDFLAEFQNLGGGEGNISGISKLNIS